MIVCVDSSSRIGRASTCCGIPLAYKSLILSFVCPVVTTGRSQLNREFCGGGPQMQVPRPTNPSHPASQRLAVFVVGSLHHRSDPKDTDACVVFLRRWNHAGCSVWSLLQRLARLFLGRCFETGALFCCLWKQLAYGRTMRLGTSKLPSALSSSFTSAHCMTGRVKSEDRRGQHRCDICCGRARNKHRVLLVTISLKLSSCC